MIIENNKSDTKNLDNDNMYTKFNKHIDVSQYFAVFLKYLAADDNEKPYKNLHQSGKLYQCKGNYDFNYDSRKLCDYAKAKARDKKQKYNVSELAALEYKTKKVIENNKGLFSNFNVTFTINTAEYLKGLEEKIKIWRKQFKENTTAVQDLQDIKDENLKLNLNNLINIVQAINPDITLSDFDDWLIKMSDGRFIGDADASCELKAEKKKNRAAYIKNILFNYYKLKTLDQSLNSKGCNKAIGSN